MNIKETPCVVEVLLFPSSYQLSSYMTCVYLAKTGERAVESARTVGQVLKT